MKNLLTVLLLFPFIISAQENCLGGNASSKIFQANRIGASFSPQGSKFLPLDGYFKMPYTSDEASYTIFASSPWIGGYIDGQLKIAAQTYSNATYLDFYTGPLLEGAVTLDSNCVRYNKIWSTSRADILRHIEDFEADGLISDTLSSVFGWPAEGNEYFSSINHFELPAGHHGGWADFLDRNQNGVYEPQLGEYPAVNLKGNYHIPEEMMWMVFNDQGPHTESEGDPLGVEIQLTVFGFNCQDNTVLNNALFNTYKVINQNATAIDSVYFGMWTDYDIGCPTDDYEGCDTIRNTEFAYNMDSVDGSIGTDCVLQLNHYEHHPPIQSLTYLSHRMTSFITGPRTAPFLYLPEERFNLLKGVWRDGTPITEYGDGYNPGSAYPETKYLFNGDPRDTAQWSQYKDQSQVIDPTTVSSVYLGQMQPYDAVRLETVYLFNQDSSLDHLGQVGFMQYQIDSVLSLLQDTLLPCSWFPLCEDAQDCVWPGDFNHNGIADHFDLLYWGVMKDSTGVQRDGKINWDGHVAGLWSLELPDGLNARHGDGNGDGHVDELDLERNTKHLLFSTPFYQPEALYPPGPHLVLQAEPINEGGAIRSFRVRAGQDIPEVLGLAYEIEFDTTLFSLQRLLSICPADSNSLSFMDEFYGGNSVFVQMGNGYSYVKTDHQSITIEEGFTFQRTFGSTAFALRPELNPDDIPDSTIIRLKNLIAIDANGNDLHIGADQLVLTKTDIVGIEDPSPSSVHVFPNPSDGFISIHTDMETGVEIFTIQSRKIMDLTASDIRKPVDVSALPSGIYVLRVMASGESIKLIIN
jgi:hypothetical protein